MKRLASLLLVGLASCGQPPEHTGKILYLGKLNRFKENNPAYIGLVKQGDETSRFQIRAEEVPKFPFGENYTITYRVRSERFMDRIPEEYKKDQIIEILAASRHYENSKSRKK